MDFPIEEEARDNSFESLKNLKLLIYSSRDLSQNLKLPSISISKTLELIIYLGKK